jgi:hypothetical protein
MLQSFALHPPSSESQQTIDSILSADMHMKLMPTHCLNSCGQLEGFMLKVPKREKGCMLPVNRTMFYGTSLFEVASGTGVFNTDIMRMQSINIKEQMKALQNKIYSQSTGKEASFECIPDVVDTLSSIRTDGAVVEGRISRTVGRRSVDFKAWEPELPCNISLLQSFIRASHQRDIRSHKLFIAVSGGLSRAADEFYNLLTDVGSEWTADEVCESEEVWWLRKASQRARARVALQTADHFGLNIASMPDLCSYNNDRIGVPVVDTTEFNIQPGDDDTVEFYSACCDSTTLQNGVIVRMHPSEGFWVFRGAAKSSSKVTNFGAMFGSKSACGVFPTRSTFYKKQQGSPSFVNGFDTEVVVRHSSAPRKQQDGCVFQCFDEQFFGNLSKMQWDRNAGVIELVPVVVGLA